MRELIILSLIALSINISYFYFRKFLILFLFNFNILFEWLRVKQDVYLEILEIIKNLKLELALPTEEIYVNKRTELWKN